MYLKCNRRRKDGKEHRYWSIMENRRCAGGKMIQRPVLYLGEINDSQREAWIRTIEVFDQERGEQGSLALFSSDREIPATVADAVGVRLSEFVLKRPRQWGACWLFTELWGQLGLREFWREKLGCSREGTDWEHALEVLVAGRLIAPGSEWHLHRHWYANTAMGDLLGEDDAIAAKDKLYRTLDLLLEHKGKLFDHLTAKWKDLFGVQYEVLLYDLTSTYFESDPPEEKTGLRRFGYSRDKRSDCVQVVIALIVTPEGFPLAYEVLPGNTADNLVGTPKGRAGQKRLARRLATGGGRGQPGGQTRLLPAQKETAGSPSPRRPLPVRLRSGQALLRSNLCDKDPAVLWGLYMLLTQIEEAFRNLKGDLSVRPIHHQLDHRIEAHIFVAFLACCVDAFASRLRHPSGCLRQSVSGPPGPSAHVTLRHRLRKHAPGLTPRAVIEKLATIQMLDAYFPTTDGRCLIFARYTQPEKDHRMLLDLLGLQLPAQKPPRITADLKLIKTQAESIPAL